MIRHFASQEPPDIEKLYGYWQISQENSQKTNTRMDGDKKLNEIEAKARGSCLSLYKVNAASTVNLQSL
ncbi:hypothetical protein Tco_0157927 [Tanacetum coccineum]